MVWIQLTGKASQTLGSVPWVLKVPQPERAYSVKRNDRLLSTMMVIWSVLVSANPIAKDKVKRLTFEDLARLIDLISHLIHIRLTEVAVRCVADFHTPPSRQEIVRTAKSVAIQRGQKLSRRVAVEVWKTESVGRDVPAWAKPQEIGQRCDRVSRCGCQDTVD